MAKRFLHITIHPEGTPPDYEALQKILDKAPDWIQYAPDCWLVWTSLSARAWCNRIRPLLHPDDDIFIVVADFEEYDGFLSRSVWEWIRKYRAKLSAAE